MPKLSLKSMSVADLVALREKVQGELARKIEIERVALQRQIAALSELEDGKSSTRGGGEPAPRRRRKADAPKISKRGPAKRRAAARYEGPNGETWSGFGRAPRWLIDLEAGGKSRESFLVAG